MISFSPICHVKRIWVLAIMFTAVRFGNCDGFYSLGKINCTSRLDRLHIPYNQIEVTAECPRFCLEEFCRVRGSNPYGLSSTCCCSAIHYGLIDNDSGGTIHVRINHGLGPPLYGSSRHGIKSRSYSSSSLGTFTFVEIKQEEEQQPTTSTVTSQSTNKLTENLPVKDPFDHEEQNKLLNSPSPTISLLRTTSQGHTEISRSFTSPRSQRNHNDENQNTPVFSISRVNFIAVIGGVLLFGIVLTLITVFTCKALRRKHKRGKSCQKSKVSSSRSDESNVCVCYQNLNTSRQGLLTDPETCDRACPMKPSSDSDLDYFMVERELVPKKEDVDDCTNSCSGKCHPDQFDF